MSEMNLTQEEIALVEEHRKEKAKKAENRLESLNLLKTAYEYEKWLQENQAGSSYATFCDYFSYNGIVRSRNFVFRAVEKIRECAKDARISLSKLDS